ncbi:MAG: histone-like protein [Candidatus Aenigmatarchaeota archaeon]
MEFSLKDAEKILKKGGMKADGEAVREFAQLLEEVTADIASEADTKAKRNRRKTVTAGDVRATVKDALTA